MMVVRSNMEALQIFHGHYTIKVTGCFSVWYVPSYKYDIFPVGNLYVVCYMDCVCVV